jgi:hypothetical protein
MRFHDKNNAVHLLSDTGSREVEIDPLSAELPLAAFFLHREFPAMRPRFRKSVQYMCKPFIEAYEDARKKLLEVLIKEPIHKSGTLIYGRGAGFTETIFYDLESKHNGQEIIYDGRIAIFACHPDKPLPRLSFYTQIKDGFIRTYQPMNLYQGGHNDSYIINDILGLLLFIQYCPLETKLVARGKKATHAREDYLNKTDWPIEIVDST